MKFTIKLDLKKIDKNRIEKKGYINDVGEPIDQLMYSIDAVELKEPKLIKEGDTWIMKKTHFLVSTPTKEERANKVKGAILGEVISFETKSPDNNLISLDNIPF